MKRIIYLILVICMSLTASICKKEDSEGCHYSVSFFNNSDRVVYATATFETLYNTGFPSPIHDAGRKRVLPQSMSTSALRLRYCYEDSFKIFEANEMLVLIINEETLSAHSWDEILERRLFLKEYRVTLDDLRRMEWRLTYTDAD